MGGVDVAIGQDGFEVEPSRTWPLSMVGEREHGVHQRVWDRWRR